MADNNGFNFFGFTIKRKDQKDSIKSFTPEVKDDGAVVVAAGGAYGSYIDLDGTVRTEAELVSKYREMALQPEIDKAVNEVTNEAIVSEDGKKTVELILDDLPVQDNLKKVINQEFENIIDLLDFKNNAYDVFKRWYIDGRSCYHIIIDEKKPDEGIKELRYIDPRKIRKIREVVKKKDSGSEAVIQNTRKEYYIYNERGLNYGSKVISQLGTTGVRIQPDSIIQVVSGLMDKNNTMVLSYLHPAIKPMNQLRALEDSTLIYHLSRAPERRIFYIDVGNLPKVKAEQYLREMMVKYKNKLSYDANTGEIRDDRKFMCYALDTKIPLLDGRTLELQQLITEYEQGKLNWVYSCDPITGKFVPGPVSWAGVTKTNSQVVKVTFDNGKSVVCTPDHKFPVWGEGFVEAQYLVGKSIIPGYRREKELYKNQKYEQIFKNDTKTWEFTHREVSKWKDSVKLREELLHNKKYIDASKNTIHHKNFNRFDNSPENLVMMNRYDHMNFHWDYAKFGFGKRINKSEDFTAEWRKKLSIAAKKRTPKCKSWKVTTPSGEQLVIENLNEFCRKFDLNRSNIKYKTSKGYKAEALRNHKAVTVEWLDEKIDVGCITVDLEETYHSHHTYLLDAGVYTKNTMLEDYWLPRREGGRGTQIEVLQGGTALPQLLESVQYFEDKLYRSLQVPLSRLKPDTVYTLGRATEISRDEVNFAKFVDRVRNKFSGLFIKALEKQLILKKIATPEDWEQIKKFIRFRFLRDNYFAELKEMEIMAERMNRLRDIDDYAGKYYSHLWIRRNVLKQSDEDIEEMNEEIAEEMENPQYNQELLMQQQMAENQPPPAQKKPPAKKDKSENKKSEGDK